MRGVGFYLGVTLSADESCGGDGGSLSAPYVKNIYGAGTGYDNIFSIAKILAELLIDPMFVKSSGII